jgi:protein-S-isoprenylcysteine O-methyltransferase Ste14
MKRPSVFSHLIALLMPFTMAVIIPLWIPHYYNSGLAPTHLASIIGIALAAVGIALFIATLRLFILVGKGTLAPWNPTKKLIITGPYRYCRNPMISGVLFVILGEAVYFRSAPLFIWAGIFFTVNTIYFIAKEEPDLGRKFGKDYKVYMNHVRRWLPRFMPYVQN